MPRARLITRSTEASQEVLQLLRGRGFEVEIVSPDEQSAQPADLEIKVEEYSVEEALDRAEQMPHAADLCAFVAPGTLSGDRVIAIPLLPDAEEDVGFVFEKQQFTTNADEPHHSTFNAALAHASAENGFEFGPSFEREADVTPEELSADIPAAVTTPAAIAMPMAESVQSSSALKRAEALAPPDVVTTRREVPSWFSSARLAFASLRGKANSWLDLAVMRSAFSSLPSQRYRARTMSDASFWKAATVIAAMAIFALLVGATARRAPLLANLTQHTNRKAPFAGARVRSISTAPSASGQIGGEPQTDRLRSSKATEIMDEILSEPAPSASNSNPRTSARSARRRSSLARHESNVVADDVVVYYAKKPVPPPLPPVVHDGIKHYSDLR